MVPLRSIVLVASLLADGAAGAAPVAGDATRGQVRFASVCASCHQVGPSARSGFGPALNGIVGRPAASTPGFAYSPALRDARIVWTPERLAGFIRDPKGVVPGTKMRFSSFGFSDADIAGLVAYLGTLPAVK